MTERDWRIYRENHSIIVKGGDIPPPLRTWSEVLPRSVSEQLRDLGYKNPTPIQMQAITVSMDRRDLLGLAPTGSGKSAAFLLPLIERFVQMEPVRGIRAEDGPYGLIMAPTRELA